MKEILTEDELINTVASRISKRIIAKIADYEKQLAHKDRVIEKLKQLFVKHPNNILCHERFIAGEKLSCWGLPCEKCIDQWIAEQKAEEKHLDKGEGEKI